MDAEMKKWRTLNFLKERKKREKEKRIKRSQTVPFRI
jgi:hypothetical protein